MLHHGYEAKIIMEYDVFFVSETQEQEVHNFCKYHHETDVYLVVAYLGKFFEV